MIALHIGDHLPRASNLWDFFGRWELDAAPLLVILAFALAYVVGLWRLRGRTTGQPVTTGRIVLFALGVLALLLALVSPISAYSQDLFFMHMIQHLLLVMIAAPLLLLANSMPIFMWSLPKEARHQVGNLMTRDGLLRRILVRLTDPKIALLLYFATFWSWHTPLAYETALNIGLFHYLEHITMFGAAIIFWWVVIGAGPLRSRIAYPARMLYLLLATIISTPLGIFITFSEGLLYSFYTDAPGHWGILVAQDQQLGGLLMWIMGNLMFLMAVTILFFVWAEREERRATQWERAATRRKRYLEKVGYRW